jgi:hypothetical protein
VKRTPLQPFALAVLALFGTAGISGCGGGSSSSAPAIASSLGRATITLQWPERSTTASRVIPVGANSIRVVFSQNGTEAQTQLLTRPSGSGALTSTASFTDLPQGDYTVTATAYPNTDGTGVMQAQATASTTITTGQLTRVGLTLGSTVDRIAILPDNIPLTAQPTVITATAFDAQNNVVVGGNWVWTNSNPAVISLVSEGGTATISAVGAGSATITLTETESGKSTQKFFDVVGG